MFLFSIAQRTEILFERLSPSGIHSSVEATEAMYQSTQYIDAAAVNLAIDLLSSRKFVASTN